MVKSCLIYPVNAVLHCVPKKEATKCGVTSTRASLTMQLTSGACKQYAYLQLTV